MTNNQNNPLKDTNVPQSEKPQDVHDTNVRNIDYKPQDNQKVELEAHELATEWAQLDPDQPVTAIALAERDEAYRSYMKGYMSSHYKLQSRIAELEKQNAVYREALEKIKNTSYDSEENKDIWHDELAEQALNPKDK